MISRNSTLTLNERIPTYLKKGVFAKMTRLDKKRERDGESPINKEDLITIAREEERRLLQFEGGMRVGGQAPKQRQTGKDVDSHKPPKVPPKLPAAG